VIHGQDTFIDGPQGKPSGGIHLLYAGENIRRDDDYNLPEIDESERAIEFQVVKLESLLLMKLTSYRLKDKVHKPIRPTIAVQDHLRESRLRSIRTTRAGPTWSDGNPAGRQATVRTFSGLCPGLGSLAAGGSRRWLSLYRM
jgi:hypothetical protein